MIQVLVLVEGGVSVESRRDPGQASTERRLGNRTANTNQCRED